ncbi:MAG: oligogalacturonate lyase family protein [Limisphaerales bacterium]
MKPLPLLLGLGFSFLLGLSGSRVTAAEPPVGWIDPDTGHRVVRLSRRPGTASLYFHQYPYSADGRKLVVTTSNPPGIAAVDLASRELTQVVEGRVRVLMTGRKSGDIHYVRDGAVWASNLETSAARKVADLPDHLRRAGNIAVNADETLLVVVGVDPEGRTEPRTPPPGRSAGSLEANWAAGTPKAIHTIDLATGVVRRIHRENDWTNHLQCSPTDPSVILFCHEGPWHYVDRVWTIRADGAGLRLLHRRTMDMEIAGHEFFGADGRTVWYDLQTPKSGVFWLAGVDLETGERTWYSVRREDWSVHYNVSPDGALFAGDGGGPESVAARGPDGRRLDPPGNGPWISLFRPVKVVNPAAAFPEQRNLIRTGTLEAERLVNLAKHNYRLEPNVTFTPDGKWIVFRSNLHGEVHTYAVEVAKSAVAESGP